MAFQKIKVIFGFSPNYWRVTNINNDIDGGNVIVTLALYKDEATSNADQTAKLEQVRFQLGANYETRVPTKGADNMKDVERASAYESTKALAIIEAAKPAEEQNADLAFFSDAVDV